MQLPEIEFSYHKYKSFLNHLELKIAPKDLFFEGDSSLLMERKRVSIVGSREASEAGIKLACVLSKYLSEKGITIVSGLAKGIDTAAHKSAITNNGKTIAVLGTPLNQCYPKENKNLLEQIKTDHLAISQFPIGYPTKRENFPQRN